jgi:site-specific recombinase XerD
MALGTLIGKANEILVIAQRLDLSADQVTREQINVAAERWARHQRRRGRCCGLRWSRERFAQVATGWLSFIGRLEIEQPERPGEQWIKPFTTYMRDERGLSPHTIHIHCWFIAKFFAQLEAQRRTLAQVTIADVEGFLISASQQGWCRVSLAKSAKVLRAFFRYAEYRRWCAMGIAAGITGPRVFRDEGLPVGPDWGDVERLIRSTQGEAPGEIRDNAILQLLAIYGLRRGEVTRLRLDDFNWVQDRICVTRPKQRCRQEYPLVSGVGCSILRYLQQVRPMSTYREVFLTLKAPIRPLSPSALSTMVAERLRALDIRSMRYGPHALRHACAGRLVAQGLSLKRSAIILVIAVSMPPARTPRWTWPVFAPSRT